MKTLLFCTSYIPDQSAWQQRYVRWLEHHRESALEADAIVMIDDHSPFEPTCMARLAASRIGQDALPAEAMVRFEQRLGRPRTMDFPGWYRGMFASVCLALHYGFERVIHVESDSFILTERLAKYLVSRTSGWTALWCPEFNCAESAIQVLCRDAFHLVEQFACEGPFAFRDKPAELTLPFTTLEKNFIGDRYHEFKHTIPADADYAVQNDAAAEPPSSVLPRGHTSRARAPIAPLRLARANAAQLASSNDQHQLFELGRQFPYDVEVARRYGIAAYQNGDFQVARAALERANWLGPDDGLTCKFLAAARMQQGELAGAVLAAAQSARHNSGDADAQNMAGAFHLQAGKQLEAIGYFRLAIALDPEATAALSNLALVDWNEPMVVEKYPDGLRGFELEVRAALLERLRANRLTPRGAAAVLAFGVHFRQGFDLLVQLARALIADPDSDAQTLFMSGNALIVRGDHEGALKAYRRAELLAPQSDRIKSAIGYASICHGGELFREGFKIANQSWPNINPAAFAANPARWTGNAQDCSKLLVYQEQGIGDALICLRFVPLIKHGSMEAKLWLRPELAALVADQTGVPLLMSDERPDPEQLGFDSATPLFGLIDALNITADRIPPPLIIKAPAASVARFAEHLKSLKRLRVGLCLFGNPKRSDDWARSVPESDITVLEQVQQVDWINLSVDARPEREALTRLLPTLTDLAFEMKDFEASAALIANLDVVISIDSVIAHLAAALGKPVLLLSPTIADWRWKIGQVQSPWWPTVEVFQTDQPGSFASAIGLVASRISVLAAGREPLK